MLTDKTTQVRDYILNLLEEKKYQAGNKLPGARALAKELNISFPKVQHAIDTLAQDGILESKDRKGTFVQKNWHTRVLHENISIFRERQYLPWLSGLENIMRDQMPGLRFTHTFKRGMLELRTTLTIQQEYHDYMDLSELLNECYPDQSHFFEHIFNPFRINGKLVGIPFAFSPRVVFFNPKVFEKAGCQQPKAGWTWDEFMECVKKIQTILPDDRILNFTTLPHYWLNFVIRSGGHLFNPEKLETFVDVDSKETQAGLTLFMELGDTLNWPEFHGRPFFDDFNIGKAAMLISSRSFLNYIHLNKLTDWKTVPLPLFPDGQDLTSQATDLLCVRESCTNMSFARNYIKMMLSEQIQDFIAAQKYAIPIRKSSAFKSIDLTDPRDSLFAVEMAKLGTEKMIEYPTMAELVTKGISRIIRNKLEIPSSTRELADFARHYLEIERDSGS